MPFIKKADAETIVKIIEIFEKHDWELGTETSRLARRLLGLPSGIPQDTLDAKETGPESDRDEVTGQGTRHSTGGWGFTGGCIARVAPA